MSLTAEQQNRIDRFDAILRALTAQLGVVQIPITRSQTIRLADGSTRTEVTGYIETAALANWQPQDERVYENSNHVHSDPARIDAEHQHNGADTLPDTELTA